MCRILGIISQAVHIVKKSSRGFIFPVVNVFPVDYTTRGTCTLIVNHFQLKHTLAQRLVDPTLSSQVLLLLKINVVMPNRGIASLYLEASW